MSAPSTSRYCFVALYLFACVNAQTAPAARDGAWWKQASRNERLGYLAGYINCGNDEAGLSGLGLVSWYNLEPRVTKYYTERPGRIGRPTGAVLLEVASDEPRRKSTDVESSSKERHGIFDGEYWRQSSPEHRLGFIEGFLDCWAREMVAGATYSHAPLWYAGQISTWFGVVADDPSEIREDRADAKIADVLRQFRDK